MFCIIRGFHVFLCQAEGWTQIFDLTKKCWQILNFFFLQNYYCRCRANFRCYYNGYYGRKCCGWVYQQPSCPRCQASQCCKRGRCQARRTYLQWCPLSTVRQIWLYARGLATVNVSQKRNEHFLTISERNNPVRSSSGRVTNRYI